MKKILMIVAIFAIHAATSTVEAQRRTNNNNRQERVRVTQHRTRPAVRTRTVQRLRPRTRIVPRRNVIRVIPQRRGRFYNDRFIYRGFGVYNRPGFGILSTFPQQTIQSVEAQNIALENALELVRARKLAKFLNRPSKRNKRKLVKYNILTGREADDINP